MGRRKLHRTAGFSSPHARSERGRHGIVTRKDARMNPKDAGLPVSFRPVRSTPHAILPGSQEKNGGTQGLSGFRSVVQNKKRRPLARRNGIRPPFVVTEFDKRRIVIQKFDDRAHLSSRELPGGQIVHQRHHIEQLRFAFVRLCSHHTIQQVTNRGGPFPAG